MAEWAYFQEYLKLDRKPETTLAELQQHGAEGWELVSAVPLPKRARRSRKADVLLVFKRPESAAGDEPMNGSAATHAVNGKPVAAEATGG